MNNLNCLRQYWWILVSLLGALLVFMMFVQGGQALLIRMKANDRQKRMLIGSLGHKWGTTFTTLVTFGGAAFASFPLFYSTSFGGAYWLWLSILILFILQAVSFEFRDKVSNLLGRKTYDFFLMLNGFLAPILIGVAVGTLFTGGAYYMDKMNIAGFGETGSVSYWANGWHGLECIANEFNLLLGLLLLFSSMTLGSLYYMWNFSVPLKKSAEDVVNDEFGADANCSAEAQAKRISGAEASLAREKDDRRYLVERAYRNFVPSAVIFLILFVILVIVIGSRPGYAADPVTGVITPEHNKYLHNLTQLVWPLVLLLTGAVLAIFGIVTRIAKAKWFSAKASFLTTGLGIVTAVTAIISCAALNNTAFFPSTVALQDSLTLANASSSLVTLKTMTYVSFFIPVVVAYIGWTWHKLAGVSKGY